MKYDLTWLTVGDVFVLLDALDLACEELEYRVTELADTGDYEPEDVDDMRRRLADVSALAARIGGSGSVERVTR